MEQNLVTFALWRYSHRDHIRAKKQKYYASNVEKAKVCTLKPKERLSITINEFRQQPVKEGKHVTVLE